MKVKFPKINFKKVSQYLLLLVVTSVIVFCTFTSLPLTEKYLKTFNNNVVFKDKDLINKVYKAEVTFSDEQKANKWRLINETKNILYRRLSKLGVEFVRIEYTEIDESKGNIFVTVRSSKANEQIETLVSTAGKIKIVIKKDEANFTDQKDPYAQYLETNYNDTELKRSDFRTIYFTKLKATTGDEAYFGIFKPWIWNTNKYDKFINQNGGKSGGINLDGFVTPVTFPVSNGNNSQAAKPIFTVSFGTDQSTVALAEIVYNSGEIQLGYEYKEAINSKDSIPTYDIYRLFIILVITIAISILLCVYFLKLEFTNTLLSYGVAVVVLITFLKLTQTPILALSLILSIIFGFIFTILYKSIPKLLPTLILISLLVIVSVPSRTIFSVYTPYLLYFVAGIPIYSYLISKYMSLFKTVFK
jgi:hypothetical protein